MNEFNNSCLQKHSACGHSEKREAKKGQVHDLFEDSFDAKECYREEFTHQKLDYIHHNPVSKEWNLAVDFTDYQHSGASFYENGRKKYQNLVHVNDALASEVPGSPFAQTPTR